jgi:fatty acid elongase 2/fatty acid elongase 3
MVQLLMKDRVALKLKNVALVHNLFLSAGSLVLLVLIASEILPSLWQHGLFSTICGTHMFNGRLECLYYINFMFKIYELFDTVLLVLKKHDLSFLHVYHHCLTFVLCFTQFTGQSSVVRP